MANNNWDITSVVGECNVDATYGPFETQEEAEFTNLHIPDNNLINYRRGRQIVSRVFEAGDLIPQAILPIGGAVLPGVDNVRAWDPYSRQWWDFQVIIQNGRRCLQGWSEYNARHRFVVGDEIRFKWVYHPNINSGKFAMIEHIRGDPGTPNHGIP